MNLNALKLNNLLKLINLGICSNMSHRLQIDIDGYQRIPRKLTLKNKAIKNSIIFGSGTFFASKLREDL